MVQTERQQAVLEILRADPCRPFVCNFPDEITQLTRAVLVPRGIVAGKSSATSELVNHSCPLTGAGLLTTTGAVTS